MLEQGQPGTSRRWSAAAGGRLRLARERSALTRAEVAGRLQVSDESVRRWEKGASKPAPAVVAAYLRVVGSDVVPVDEVVEEPDEQASERQASDAEIGLVLRRRRVALGLTQVQAAQVIGVGQATLAGWEIGRARPGRDLAAALAQFLGDDIAAVDRLLRPQVAVEMANWPMFGRILGERRVTLQLDRAEVAKRLQVSPRTVAAWEIGEKVPNNGHLDRLSELLGVERAVLVSALPERQPPCDLGRIIVRRQRLLGLSRDDLAYECSVTPITISRWIAGRNVPTDGNVRELARILELDERVIRSAIEVDAAR